jgi:hypothetical protein
MHKAGTFKNYTGMGCLAVLDEIGKNNTFRIGPGSGNKMKTGQGHNGIAKAGKTVY